MLVSVVMPCFNAGCYIAEAIQSILGQTYKDFELIIVNDASTDQSQLIIDHYVKSDKRVKCLTNTQNMGISYSRNRGVKEAKGQYVAVMDSDDIASPERLKRSLAALKKADMVYSAYLQSDPDGHLTGLVEPEPPSKLNMAQILKTQMVPHVTMMGKRELFQYKDDYHTNDDLYIVSKMFHDGVKFRKIREPLMIVRYHNSSTSQTKLKDIKRVASEVKKEFGSGI